MIIDSHCHFSEFGDLRETVRTALAHGVWGVVAVGCDAETNARTLAAAAAAPKAVWACLGFHPDWTQLTDEDLDLVAAQIAVHHSRIVGLGEVGLPWYSLEGRADAAALMARGRARLDRLLRLASRWDLPVALHAPHGAAVGALGALRAHGIERAVFHWHKAPADVTQAIVDAGYYVSVTPRSEEHTSELQSLRHLVCRLLLEKKKKERRRASCAVRKREALHSAIDGQP